MKKSISWVQGQTNQAIFSRMGGWSVTARTGSRSDMRRAKKQDDNKGKFVMGKSKVDGEDAVT